DRDGEDERVVLLGRDLDAVGLPDAEPAFRDLGDLVAAALDLVLVVDDVALRLHVLTAVDRDGKAVAERRDERLLHRRDGARVVLDLHRVPAVELLLLDLVELGARRVLEDERLPDPEGLAIDLEGALALLVLDPEVVADRPELLTHPVLRPAAVSAASQEWHRTAPFGLGEHRGQAAQSRQKAAGKKMSQESEPLGVSSSSEIRNV